MKEEKKEIQCILFSDKKYPKLLRQLPDPPPQLYYRGDLEILNNICLAVVGSRKYSEIGKRSCQKIVGPLAKNGIVIISGLAIGIDSIAHQTTLENGGKTVAVLGTGLNDNVIYPKQNIHLLEKIIDNGGLVLTEYPPESRATRYSFPQRNRIIAGLSIGTLVVEADIKSGSLITASCALDYNRDVFAVPYEITQKQGTNELLKNGAYLVNSSEDITNILIK